jgi:sigma-B regulation protein RsbU (phosphoserine phosphatase)
MTRDLEREIDNAARELAERYEEINLLYSISEILGRTVSLSEAASTILREISETVGARLSSILVLEPGETILYPVAALGTDTAQLPAVDINDQISIPARVFRTRHPAVIDPGEPAENDLFRRGAMLAVPIMWTNPNGRAEPLGVVSLSDRRSGQPFSAGDVKLVAAIATQIGSAIQNARLVRASLEQQRLLQEMQLAHDLQMKLLPNTSLVSPQAEAAARVVPAESVGGDFYHLFRLTPTATGVLLGDVSSHGYRAALIMALAMSASAIHAQGTLDPGAMLHALLDSLRDELISTEMFIAMFYGVIDTQAGILTYANTGHPHAFIFRTDGTSLRLPAIDPPLGMSNSAPMTKSVPWIPGKDLLVLFTDGIADARNSTGERFGEGPVLNTIAAHLTDAPSHVVDRVFTLLNEHTGDTPLRDDLTLVVLRS